MKRPILKLVIGVVAAILIISSLGKSESYIKDRAVKLFSKDGSCSGQQIRSESGKDYVLSAGHCIGLKDQDNNIMAKTEDGREIPLKVIAKSEQTDLLLLEGVPGMRGLDIADSWYRNQEVRAFTHGHGLDLYKSEGVLIQHKEISMPESVIGSAEDLLACGKAAPKKHVERGFFGELMCMINIEELLSTTRIAQGSSGGVLVDSRGDVVGIASVTSDDFSGWISIEHIKEFLKDY